jgi:hypothetical protein
MNIYPSSIPEQTLAYGYYYYACAYHSRIQRFPEHPQRREEPYAILTKAVPPLTSFQTEEKLAYNYYSCVCAYY